MAMAALAFFAVKTGIAEISREKEELREIRKNIDSLKAKDSALREVQSSTVAQVDAAVQAVPSVNPVLLVISQIKNLGAEKGIVISKLQAGGGAGIKKTELDTSDVSFDAQGDMFLMLDFIKSFARISPLTTIEKITFSQTGGVGIASIVVKSYWAGLPEKIPSAIQPLVGLTSEEEKTLAKIQGLIPLPYSKLTPLPPSGRSNPFSL